MTRALLPGRWRRDGSRPSLPSCSGSCDQGRRPCDCTAMPRPALRLVLHPDLHRVTLTELDLELPPSDTRTFSPPNRPAPGITPPRARSIFIAVVSLALLAFGLWIFPH